MSQQKPMISLSFSAMAGAKFSHPFPPECKPQDLYKVVTEKLYPHLKVNVQPGCDDRVVFPFKLLFQGKTIPSNDRSSEDKKVFEEMKTRMNPRTVILVGEKLSGGTDMQSTDMETFTTKFFTELKSALNKLPIQSGSVCSVCQVKKDCICFTCPTRSCRNVVCKTCVPENFAQKGYILPCCICSKIIELDTFIPSDAFKMLYNHFEDLIEQQRNIDFQICKCGKFFINTTMYSRQQCPSCKRWMCFFCNADWDSGTMKNKQYTCSSSCIYQQYLIFELIPMKEYPNVKLPSARCCPKCSTYGMYGDKCRMHKCNRCSRDGPEYWFCFFCLKTETECKRLHGYNTFSKCGEAVVQNYTVFPRIGN